jgi:hypothetical protein
MARKEKPERVERGLYLAGKTYLACATPPGSRKVKWKTIGEVGLMEARRKREAWAVEVRSGGISAMGAKRRSRGSRKRGSSTSNVLLTSASCASARLSPTRPA